MENNNPKTRITLNDDLFVVLPADWDYVNESYSEKDWEEAFHWLHIYWDNRIGKSIVDAFEENTMKFKNPHDLSDKIFRYIFKGIESTDNIDLDDAEEFAERIEEFMMEEYRNDKKSINRLAEMCVDVEKKGNK